MRKSKYSQLSLLRGCIERSFDEFKAEMTQLDSESVFRLAPIINAVCNVHFYITNYEWADEEALEFLLKFDNPLKLLADAWEEYSDDRRDEFSVMLAKLVENGVGDLSDYHITAEYANELREKHGKDVPLISAVLNELIENFDLESKKN